MRADTRDAHGLALMNCAACSDCLIRFCLQGGNQHAQPTVGNGQDACQNCWMPSVLVPSPYRLPLMDDLSVVSVFLQENSTIRMIFVPVSGLLYAGARPRYANVRGDALKESFGSYTRSKSVPIPPCHSFSGSQAMES